MPSVAYKGNILYALSFSVALQHSVLIVEWLWWQWRNSTDWCAWCIAVFRAEDSNTHRHL